MNECLFCKFINGEIETHKVFENDNVLGFKDINPGAVIHNLFIHKKHSHDIVDLCQQDITQVSDIFLAISDWVKSEGLDQSGFRLINNMGSDGGQTIFHTHFHLLAGQKLKMNLN